MSDWREIRRNNRPKDFVEVLVYAPNEEDPVFTAEFFGEGWHRSSGRILAARDDFFGDAPIYPTHWMPLPEPPK